jgi:mono/diheme cytochrome c family protein
MNEEQKHQYHEQYKIKKQKGEKFWPDEIYKDLMMFIALFILLIGLAAFIGVANEPKADPADSNYIPRPEWYFLFLFQMLKFFPGAIEWVGTAIIPGIAVGILFILPFIDRSPFRHYSKRKLANIVMGAIVVGIVALTIWAEVDTRKQLAAQAAEGGGEAFIATTLPEKILAGEEIYSIQCVECHGAEGEGGEIKGVEGLEGVILPAINATDVMYTFTDDTLANIVSYGQPDQGMPPFSRQYGGELSPGEVEAVVDFMRYSWDDRAELPAEVTAAQAIPKLAPGEVPSYEVHVAPMIKRYCLSCHRPGKKNNNYLMRDYTEVMTSGDNADKNIIPGDSIESHMIRQLNREDLDDAGGPMPPTKALKPEIIEIFTRWVAGGSPNTAADAAAATAKNAPPPEAPAAETPAADTPAPVDTPAP